LAESDALDTDEASPLFGDSGMCWTLCVLRKHCSIFYNQFSFVILAQQTSSVDEALWRHVEMLEEELVRTIQITIIHL
jgi:hypothetical protein